MKRQFRIVAGAACLMLGLLVLGAIPSLGNGPFHDDTHPPCLGADDPFCNSGEDGGGGSGGSFCYACKTTIPETGPPTIECDSGSLGDTCTITYESNGDISCDTTGDC